MSEIGTADHLIDRIGELVDANYRLTAERDLLRAALKEALDFWSSSLYSGGRRRDGTDDASARIHELRKLVAP